jgi:hypothetical protein
VNENSELLSAFSELYRRFGPPAEPYINIDAFWNRPGMLDDWRLQLEKYISAQYLPGFKFESDKHFKWHFNLRDDPFMLLRWSRDPQRAFDQWIRAFMVPRPLHYHAEVAWTLREWEKRNQWRFGDKWSSKNSWKARARHIMGLSGDHAVDEKSFRRWANQALDLREERSLAPIPSMWYIDQIELEGDSEIYRPCLYDHTTVHPDTSDFYYRETWRWLPTDDTEPPMTDHITFAFPAHTGLWAKGWKSNRPQPLP